MFSFTARDCVVES